MLRLVPEWTAQAEDANAESVRDCRVRLGAVSHCHDRRTKHLSNAYVLKPK